MGEKLQAACAAATDKVFTDEYAQNGCFDFPGAAQLLSERCHPSNEQLWLLSLKMKATA
jgi:hypothetical protein